MKIDKRNTTKYTMPKNIRMVKCRVLNEDSQSEKKNRKRIQLNLRLNDNFQRYRYKLMKHANKSTMYSIKIPQ